MTRLARTLAACAAALVLAAAPVAEACTRVVYLGPDGRILTGRTMDWKMPILWCMEQLCGGVGASEEIHRDPFAGGQKYP